MNIRLRIDRLVLEGIPLEGNAIPALRMAMENEFARLLAEGGLAEGLQNGGRIPASPAGKVQLEPHSRPGYLGRQIARAVYEGIGQNERGGPQE